MSSALAVSQASESKWTVVSGPMKGSVRLMNTQRFTVGRSPECEFVVINDPKCSRQHATIVCTSDGCEVISMNDKNLVLVNGRAQERAVLHDGDVVTFGETEIQYNSTSMPTGFENARLNLVPAGGAAPAYPGSPMPRSRSSRRGQARSGGNPMRIVIYGVVGLFLLLIILPSVSKKKPTPLRNEQQIQADLEAANKIKESSEVALQKRWNDSMTSRQAQENYVRGFRDYQKGQYEHAIISFQACLALNPAHALCNRYFRLSQRKFNELIQYEVVLGRKYRDQNQFSACRAAFRNVMFMVKDANSPTYKEARANYEACNASVEGRF
jgi:hypothetical protein